MTAPSPNELAASLRKLDAGSPLYATEFVDLLLAAARAGGASDVHLQPTVGRNEGPSYEVRWRIDGVLQLVGEFPRGSAADVVSRLKVLAGLLTYRADVPQEGRIRSEQGQPGVEMRVSTFPTLHGERAVVRLFAGESQFHFPQDLGLPEEIEAALLRLLAETSGAILITGPAGSGKTTTAYACLREVVRTAEGRRSVVSLEDPIEVAIAGVSQSQVHPASGFDLATGLRSLMRQDPEVILVGEIRDRPTAETVFQAALTGHLILSTFHAGGAAGGISRLIDMGIEPYLLRSGVRAMLHQRLVRRLCECAMPAADGDSFLGLPLVRAQESAGCEACRHTGYRGRLVLAELLPPLVGELGEAVLSRRDALELARLATAAGMTTLFQRACTAIESGVTDPAEVRRVLGFAEAAGELA
ncbi:MAG TPA: GspE/PulE family protein [Pirellulaceae bacterium]|nr:GspE/PulE family protein [Pirellulaceae bacterium]